MSEFPHHDKNLKELLAATLFIQPLSEETRTAIVNKLIRIAGNDGEEPPVTSRLGLALIAYTANVSNNYLNSCRSRLSNMEVSQLVNHCAKYWTREELNKLPQELRKLVKKG